jgi:hypothetical protein
MKLKSIFHLLKSERYIIALTASEDESSSLRGGESIIPLIGAKEFPETGCFAEPKTLFSIFSSVILSSTACWSAIIIIDLSIILAFSCGKGILNTMNFVSACPMTLAFTRWLGDNASGNPSAWKNFGYWKLMVFCLTRCSSVLICETYSGACGWHIADILYWTLLVLFQPVRSFKSMTVSNLIIGLN